MLSTKPSCSESPDVCSDEKHSDENLPIKKAKIDVSEVSQINNQAQTLNQNPSPLQQLISNLITNVVRLDAPKNQCINPFVTTLTCGVPVTDASRLPQGSIASIALADLLAKQNAQPNLSSDINSDGLLTAICETPGQPPKSVLISKSVAAAFAAAAMAGNNMPLSANTPKPAEECASATGDSQPPSTTNSVDSFTTLANGNINLVRCDALAQGLSGPISINLPVSTSTTTSQPSFTVIGSLSNNGPAILSIGNAATAGRNITSTNSASTIAALLRQLSQQKPVTDVDMPPTSIVTTLSSETPITTASTLDTKPVSEPLSPTNLPVDLNSLAAAVAAVTSALPRNPTITPGPVPGSILLSCPKLTVSGDQATSLLNVVSQASSEGITTPATITSTTANLVKAEPYMKGSNDPAIDQILENIRRASETEKTTTKSAQITATPVATKPGKLDETRTPLLMPTQSSCGGGGSNGRMALPLKKSGCKLAPVAPSPGSKADIASAMNPHSATVTTSTPRHSSIESVHKVYKCRYCGKTFNRKFCRERHERLHTGVKPYTCEICDEKFIRLEDKKRHVRSILHTSRVAAAQASGRAIPTGLDPQDMSEGDASPASDHRETESSDDPIPLSISPSPPSQAAAFKHSRRSELKQSSTPIRLLTTEGTEVG